MLYTNMFVLTKNNPYSFSTHTTILATENKRWIFENEMCVFSDVLNAWVHGSFKYFFTGISYVYFQIWFLTYTNVKTNTHRSICSQFVLIYFFSHWNCLLKGETLLHVLQTRVTAWQCPPSGMTPYTFYMLYLHTSSATEVCGNEDRKSFPSVSVHKTRRKHTVRNGYRFKREDTKYFTDNCDRIIIRGSIAHLDWVDAIVLELYGVPGMTLYISCLFRHTFQTVL